jgi:myo-inositol 2-dehydrogenase / D-chiro-inositol 1-dehydrogenase
MNRVALIGCGAIAESGHVPALLRHDAFTIAAVCDVREDRARRLAQHAGGVPHYTDWQVMLDGGEFDGAVLALPPEVSADIAIACLRRGLSLLDEKPLAATLEQGRRVARAVAETGGVFQLGFVLRYGEWIDEIARLARSIGAPLRTRVAIYDERLDPDDPAHFERIAGFLRTSSAITHEGSHVVDYVARWSPAPWALVEATAQRTSPDLPGPNVWRTVIEQADGSEVEIEIGWLLPELPPCAVSVEGSGGRVDFNPTTGVVRWDVGGRRGAMTLTPMRPEWDRQYDAFAKAILNGVATVATLEDGLRALEITAGCEESARTGAVIRREVQAEPARK